MAVAGSVCVCVGGGVCVCPPLPAFVPSKKRGLGSVCVCVRVSVSPSTALQASRLLSLFKLAVKLWLFKVKLVPVKANGCLLYRQVFLKNQNILELICEILFIYFIFIFFFFYHVV